MFRHSAGYLTEVDRAFRTMNFRTQSPCLVFVLSCFISFGCAQWDNVEELLDVLDYQNSRPRRQLQFSGDDEDTNTANLDDLIILGPIKLGDKSNAVEPVQTRVVKRPTVSTVVTEIAVPTIRSQKTVLIPETFSSVTVLTSKRFTSTRSQVPIQPSTVTMVVTSYVQTTVTDTLRFVPHTIRLTATTTFTEAPVTSTVHVIRTQTVHLPAQTVTVCYDDEQQKAKTQNVGVADAVISGKIPQSVPEVAIEDQERIEIVNANRVKMGLPPVSITKVTTTPSPGQFGFTFDSEPIGRPYDADLPASRPAYNYDPPTYAPRLHYPGSDPRVPNVVATTQSPRFVRAADLRRMLVEQYEDELERTFDFDDLY